MTYVYLLRSCTAPSQIYTGMTSDLSARLQAHNSGQSKHTVKYRPWQIECFVAFPCKTRAAEFERYLKTGSGRAFAKKRLLSAGTSTFSGDT